MRKAEEHTKIEKNIPFPVRRYGPKTRYPWKELGIGDSFAFDGSLANARSAATYYNERMSQVFRARAYNGHIRVWRVK